MRKCALEVVQKSTFDHEVFHDEVSTSNLAFTLEEHMLTMYVSFGNIPGTHIGPKLRSSKSFSKKNSLRKHRLFGFSQPEHLLTKLVFCENFQVMKSRLFERALLYDLKLCGIISTIEISTGKVTELAKKQFAVIGMGRFGSSVARAISDMGFEVLAIDSDEGRVQDIVNIVTHAVSADSTDEEALKALGIRNFDVVVVSIGQDIQSSILTTLILKDLGVPRIIVKAQNELHGKVLNKIGADKVIYPERDMGLRVAHHLVSPNIMDFIELSSDHSIIEMQAAPQMVGKNLKELDVRAKFGCNVMAIKNNGKMNISPNADDGIKSDDILIIVGANKDLQKMEIHYSNG